MLRHVLKCNGVRTNGFGRGWGLLCISEFFFIFICLGEGRRSM